MITINEKLESLQQKMDAGEPVKIMIIGLGSVGLYLLEYLLNFANPKLQLIVVGRNKEKMLSDVNIVRTAATIRRQMRSTITIEGGCDLEDIDSITEVLSRYNPDFIVNSSRVYSGLKYGSISWKNVRAYGIWSPLSIRYARNIMEAYAKADSKAISINTSYSDAVIPWLKSAGKAYFDFGSGNLNHLIPRMKFYIAEQYGIDNLNEIDITLAVSHFHDVVISKEGQTEGQNILLSAKYRGTELDLDKTAVAAACKIAMPTDQKRNMMNASSNLDIINSILTAITEKKKVKIHGPGINGEIGGYPYIIDGIGDIVTSYFDTSVWNMDEMRTANRASIYMDGIKDIKGGSLFYTSELIAKAKKAFGETLPKEVKWDEIEDVGNFLINKIIKSQLKD